MDPQRIQAAIARIEAAAERIAATSRDRTANPVDADLDRRHRKLREEAHATLADLDQLILELER